MSIFRYLTILLAALLLASCHKPRPAATVSKTQTDTVFTDIVRLPMTPVKNQGRSAFCWIYAMLATIETEHLGAGDSVNLSADYVARMHLAEQTRRRYLSNGRKTITQRSMMPMLIHLIHRYGAEPESSYHARKGRVNYHIVARQLARIADTAHSLAEVQQRTDTLLNERIDFLPRFVFLYGAEYTPLEFAHSVCRRDEYVALTSFSHHPFGHPFVLEMLDNQEGDEFVNLPIDRLMQVITRSIAAGHPVCWEGDISEDGFSFEQGTATLHSEKPCTQAERQREFDRLRTTDDHCMALIGLAHDRQGRRYFVAKNSWGTRNPYGGLMYLSENYVRLKTVAVVVNSECWPTMP